MKNILICTFLSLVLVSCAGKQTTEMKISFGAVTGSGNFPGGLIVMGESDAGEKFIQKVPSNDELIIEVPNGVWSFATFGWDGSEIFEGTSYCDVREDIQLNGGDFNLNLSATAVKCNHPVFGSTVHPSTSDFLPLRFSSCMGIQNYIANGDVGPDVATMVCDGSDGPLPGGAASVKVSLYEFALGTAATAGQTGLTSKCYDLTGPEVNTNIKLPFGASDVPMPYKIEAFPSASCGGTPEVYIFTNGLSVTPVDNRAVAVLDNTNHRSVVLLHTDSCTGSMLTNTPFANSPVTTGNTRLICNETQWNNISTELGNGESYQLGQDIDFEGSNTTISTDFKGEIQGGMFSLKNGDNPLFETIVSRDNERTSIRNITIDNFNITITSGGSSSYGIMANEMRSTGTADSEGIELDNIEIKSNSSISVNDVNYTGKLGGVIGVIDTDTNDPASTQEYLSLRFVRSMANVTSTSTQATSSTGGLVGAITGSVTSNNGGISLEFNSVGFKEENQENPTRINVYGGYDVGGLVGYLNNAEIRDGNFAFVNMKGTNHIGGLIGRAYKQTRVNNSFADVYFTPEAVSSDLGGAIGQLNNDSELHMDGVVGVLKTPETTSFKVDYVGGLVGYATYSVGPTMSIKNSKGYIETSTDGQSYGGIFGNFNGQSGSATVESSVAIANISTQTADSSLNTNRGGIAGRAKYLTAKDMVVQIGAIIGHQSIGGGFGTSESATIENTDIVALLLESDRTGANNNIGGVVGYVNTTGTTTLNDIKADITNISLSGKATANCATDSCGLVIGKNSQTTMTAERVISVVTAITDNNSPLTPIGAGANWTDGTHYNNVFDDDAIVEDCTTAGAKFEWDAGNSICNLVMRNIWKDFGSEVDTETGLTNYFSGGGLEPLLIEDENDWNDIQDKAILMSKTFKLTNDIDFQNGTFNPIGSAQSAGNKFKGRILPDGNKIMNITYTTASGSGETAGGLFPKIESARIGHWDDPLVIENLSLDGTLSNVGVIGQAEGHSEVMIQVKNGSITTDAGTTIGVGGIVGYIWNGNVRVSDSSYEGSIDAPDAEGVGGIVGDMSDSGGIEIEKTSVKLKKIIGENSVGGFVGTSNDSNKVNISNSYVWFDINGDQNGSNDDVVVNAVSAQKVASLVGNANATAATKLNIKNVYADISNAQVDSNMVSLVQGGAFGQTNINLSSTVIVDPNDISDSPISNTVTHYDTQALLQGNSNFNTSDDRSDWVVDTNGRLVLRWEVHGFDHN